jgi:hypothetical protein
MYEKSDIVKDMMMYKDASVLEPAKSSPTLSDLAERLDSVRKKLAIVRQFVEQNRR